MLGDELNQFGHHGINLKLVPLIGLLTIASGATSWLATMANARTKSKIRKMYYRCNPPRLGAMVAHAFASTSHAKNF